MIEDVKSNEAKALNQAYCLGVGMKKKQLVAPQDGMQVLPKPAQVCDLIVENVRTGHR